MALDSNELRDALTDMFEGKGGFPESSVAAAKRLAGIYQLYASAAEAGQTRPVVASLVGAAEALASVVGAALDAGKAAGPEGVPALGIAMDKAFVAFWFMPPVALVFPTTGTPTIEGIVTTALPGILGPALTSLFERGVSTGATAAQQAQAMAVYLHDWTRTVMVLNTPPGPPAVPLT